MLNCVWLHEAMTGGRAFLMATLAAGQSPPCRGPRLSVRLPLAGGLIALAVLSAGCGRGERLYHISGTVTFAGKPVPKGTIVFEPDTSRGNQGAAGFAQIADGRFDTRVGDGKGTVGGPHLVRILGLDGVPRGELVNGSPLFPEYHTTADLPMQDTTLDFQVPLRGSRSAP